MIGKLPFTTVVLVLVCLALSGCVDNRDEIAWDDPPELESIDYSVMDYLFEARAVDPQELEKLKATDYLEKVAIFNVDDEEGMSTLRLEDREKISKALDNSSSALTVINNPRFNGFRIDWCLAWGSQCGRPAASIACKLYGFDKSASYRFQSNYGLTYVLADDRVCTASYCDAFDWILCE